MLAIYVAMTDDGLDPLGKNGSRPSMLRTVGGGEPVRAGNSSGRVGRCRPVVARGGRSEFGRVEPGVFVSRVRWGFIHLGCLAVFVDEAATGGVLSDRVAGAELDNISAVGRSLIG